jgi:hypothetical protein
MRQEGLTWEDSSASRSDSQQDRRELRDLCAIVENAILPELGSLAARCSRLVSHASLAFSEPLHTPLSSTAFANIFFA